jgi:hypothetical protein
MAARGAAGRRAFEEGLAFDREARRLVAFYGETLAEEPGR